MEAKLKTDTIEYLKKRAETAFTHEETAEIIVPDAMPDIIDIVDTQGTVTIRSKEAASGKLIFSGMVTANVIYRSEDESTLNKLEISIPFTAEMDAPDVTEDSLLCSKVNIGCLDSRMINSRKALVRADVVITASAYQRDEFRWSGDIEDDFDAGIESLMGKAEVNFVTQVKEKTFVLADEFTLPVGKPIIEEFLKTCVRIESEDVKSVGNKLIFKGDVRIDILYKGEGEQEPQSLNYSAPFSQILEMDSDTEGADFDIKLMLTNCYVENGSSVAAENAAIAVEMHLVAQAVCRETFEIPYISDVYSTKFNLTEHRGEIGTESEEPLYKIAADAREQADVAESVHKIIDSSFTVGKVFWGEEDGALSLKVTVCASAMYLTDGGKICGINRRFEVKGVGDLTPGMSYHAVAYVLSEAQAIPMGNSIEFRIPIHFDIRPSKTFKGSTVTGVSWDEEEQRDLSALPSLVVHHVLKDETLWVMAKKYCSSEELIVTVNNMEEGMEPEAGKLFIIPRKK